MPDASPADNSGLFGFDPPDLSDDEVERIANELYGLSGSHRRLRGERSHNTLFTDSAGSRFVLRVAGPSEQPSTIDLQTSAYLHLASADQTLPISRLRPTRAGAAIGVVERNGQNHCVHLVTFLPGVTFADEVVVSTTGLMAIGDLLGRIASALAGFDHQAADQFMPWDLTNGLILDETLWGGLAPDARLIVAQGRSRLEALTSVLPTLTRQVIHNDGHRGNLLRSDETSDLVTGIIDFGDLVRTVKAADLAVSGANFVGNQPDAAGALAMLAAGFHRHSNLTKADIEALPDLVLARLTLSTLLVEYQINNSPHIADAVALERPGLLGDLQRWLEIDPVYASTRIREAL